MLRSSWGIPVTVESLDQTAAESFIERTDHERHIIGVPKKKPPVQICLFADDFRLKCAIPTDSVPSNDLFFHNFPDVRPFFHGTTIANVLEDSADWVEWRRSMLMTRIIIGIFIGAWSLSSAPISHAAPKHMQDTSKQLYNRVMKEFKHRDYEAALAGFRLFIELHGQSTLAANAQYWIGECQFRMKRYTDALDSFYNVLMYYPLSPKLPASTLKLAQTYTKLGDPEKARSMFSRILERYPDSSEAEVARKAIESTEEKSDGGSDQTE